MTKQEAEKMIEAIQRVAKEACKSKESARQFLIDAGIIKPRKRNNMKDTIISSKATQLIGKTFLYELTRNGVKTLTHVIIEGVKKSPGIIKSGKKSYTAIKFRMRPTKVGGRAFWSTSYADKLIK